MNTNSLLKNQDLQFMNYIPDPYQDIFFNGIYHPELYLWDSWSYEEDSIIHLYCLAVSRHKSDGNILHPHERNNFPFHIRHFISKDDGISWKDEGCFLKAGKDSGHNYRTIWSGSVNPMPNGKKLVAFTGLEDVDENHLYRQNIVLGISDDGFNIDNFIDKKILSSFNDWRSIINKGYYLDKPDNLGSNLGEEDGPIMAWRDPYILYDKEGKLNIFWSAKKSPRIGVMARATVINDRDTFKLDKLYSPISVPDEKDFTQLEVPKIVYDKDRDKYYLIISTCNRLYESQPDNEVSKEVRLYKSSNLNGPWESLGNKILNNDNLFGLTVLKTDFKNNRLLCIAPYTEMAEDHLRLSFAPTFYIYLNPLRVEFLT